MVSQIPSLLYSDNNQVIKINIHSQPLTAEMRSTAIKEIQEEELMSSSDFSSYIPSILDHDLGKFFCIHSRLSRILTARGSCTGLVTVGKSVLSTKDPFLVRMKEHLVDKVNTLLFFISVPIASSA